ncbi:MAG: arylesterase [Gammaproteobacteria bacterium]|nr:arylesterase [Gammaproteobacteria bacterium]
MQTNKNYLSSVLFLTTLSLISLIITLSNGPAIAAAPELKNRTILLLGDSLSAGHGIEQGKNWTDLLQHRLNKNNQGVQLINASISGDTSANGLNRLPGAIEQYQPELIIIELGGNDGLRGLSISHIRNNLESLIQSGLDARATVLLMEIRIPPNYGKKYTQAFSRIYPQLAKKYSLPLIPFILNQIALKPELMQADGIHPNEKAQAEIMETLWQALKPLL